MFEYPLQNDKSWQILITSVNYEYQFSESAELKIIN